MVQQYISALPPPYPPLPIRVWKDTVPTIMCPLCGSTFNVSKGPVECPKCGTSYIVAEWSWESFLAGLAVGLLIGLILSVGIYYFVFRPYVPVVRLAATFREFFKA